ncbi:hypothetical protein [Snuella sedimenti]|uniref:Uncharacterized protein n=1 Tax=Snuella sedimenti TaxID=2798802 RepID=A0A8J7LNU6_9FLAO|nr:hypothetical protein [Snuella sedimenti]MBJ6369039.1 hypothetical protein [Snuella sedimenti]
MTIDIIDHFFSSLEGVRVKDTFDLFRIDYKTNDLKLLKEIFTKENYTTINEELKKHEYSWDVSIDELDYSISQNSFSTPNIDDESFDVVVEFNIYKTSNRVVIFDESLFNDFINKIDYENLLLAIKRKPAPIEFINDSSVFYGDSNIIILGNTKDSVEKANLSYQCNFRNYNQINFSPNYFHLPNVNDQLSVLETKLKKLNFVYCLVYICNSSEIHENNLDVTISGNKTLKYSLNINEDLDLEAANHYYNIYKWIYSESTKIEDKLGLSRNIITSYLKEDSISIDGSVFNSILSSNQIYVKGNINKYFEVRNKIIEQIEQTISKVNQSLDTFFNNFQKNILIFLSFFLSIFIYKISRNGDVEKIFNEDTSMIGLYFVAISACFLLVSYIIYRMDKKRVGERYENVKKRYQDVLIQDDIDKIINNDAEYKDEIKFLEKRIGWYVSLWIISIILFVVILFLTSSYLNLTSLT